MTSLIDPFSFEKPPRKTVDEELQEIGGFRIFPFHKFTGAGYSYGKAVKHLDLSAFLSTPSHNLVDEVSKLHDGMYFVAKTKEDLIEADKQYISLIDKLKPFMTLRERGEAELAKRAFQVKTSVGGYSKPDWSITEGEFLSLQDYLSNTITNLNQKYQAINTSILPKYIQDFINVNEPLMRRLVLESVPGIESLQDLTRKEQQEIYKPATEEIMPSGLLLPKVDFKENKKKLIIPETPLNVIPQRTLNVLNALLIL